MKKVILLLSIIGFCFGCAKAISSQDEIAAVNGQKITMAMIDEKIDELPEYYQSVATQHKREILDDLIVEKLLFEEAQKRKLTKDADVRKLIDKAARRILIAKLLEIETSAQKAVSDEEVAQYYQQHKDQYLVPERVQASHILLNSEEEAKEVQEKLKAGADFAEMAKAYSKDLTKDRGGDLGYFQKGQMIPEFEQACFELNVGQTSGIVKTRFGYHIIKLTDKRAPEYKSLDEVKEKIREGLISQSKQQQFRDFVERLKQKAKVTVKEEAFKAAPAQPVQEEAPLPEEETQNENVQQ